MKLLKNSWAMGEHALGGRLAPGLSPSSQGSVSSVLPTPLESGAHHPHVPQLQCWAGGEAGAQQVPSPGRAPPPEHSKGPAPGGQARRGSCAHHGPQPACPSLSATEGNSSRKGLGAESGRGHARLFGEAQPMEKVDKYLSFKQPDMNFLKACRLFDTRV